MTITGAIVLFAVIWFLCLFIALQVRITSQSEDGHVEPGTPASAPAHIDMKRRFLWVTAVTVVLWAIACAVIMAEIITIQDIDVFGRYGDGHY
ncbi:DUF1467 domain-containing protein [Maritimibacter sp. 55A14]|uniref:DUF1467 family protein n=1 Tax=Maritimibacter sp. 55A14 TaxID=2174844 RepID=UPI000D6179A9|nr:DUF1467 family protein [Maritimibacter sp. 55A14]PWE33336.1 DUF1467 domain-containing protein [Maritimibacter sp. 55A14]